MKTISLSDGTHKELMGLKLEYNVRAVDKLIKRLLLEHKKMKFFRASKVFRQKMKQKKIGLDKLSKSSIQIGDEIYDEWFT